MWGNPPWVRIPLPPRMNRFSKHLGRHGWRRFFRRTVACSPSWTMRSPWAWRSTRPGGAVEHGDVPIGAVVLRAGEVIAARHNERELAGDPTAHAEILALRDAARRRRTLAPRRLHARRHARAVRDVRRRRRQRPRRRASCSAPPTPRRAPWAASTTCRRTAAEPPAARHGRRPCGRMRRACCDRSSPSGASLPPRKDARADEWDGLESR